MQTRTVFVSGHLDLTSKEFERHYLPALDRWIAEGAAFVVGDARGCDLLVQHHLAQRCAERLAQGLPEVDWRVFHMFTAPRNNVGDRPTVGGFTSDEARDSAMTAASARDLAWVRPGRERSGTARNLRRRGR